VELLQAKMENTTTWSYSAGFVVAKDVCNKQYFKLNNLESYKYEVIVPGYQTTASKISQPSSLQREDVQDICLSF
jgi:hypothetical protein